VGALLLFTALAAAPSAAVQQPEILADVRVHGNVLTPDDEIKRLAGITAGSPVTPETAADVTARLRDTGRFKRVEVLKRFASIADPTLVVLVIVVDEGAVAIQTFDDAATPPRVVKRRWPNMLIFPILDAEDGYGVRYGVQFGLAGRLGANSRLSFPLTWGGEKKAGAEFDKIFASGPIGRVTGGAAVVQRTNPFAEQADTRRRVWLRAERPLASIIRLGAGAGRQHVSFAGTDDRFTHAGADIALDTRRDPVLPRNAVDIRAGIERLTFASIGSATRTEIDARGYVGLIGQNVIAVRALRQTSNRPLPLYARPLLGGMANLRGFPAGAAAGDTLVAGSIEALVPLTSPLSIGRFGVSAFVDAGTVYPHGERFADHPLKKGVGGTVWFSAAFIRLGLAVARGVGATTRVHVGGSVLF
jgi:outer membrane protein assembly factor BamA